MTAPLIAISWGELIDRMVILEIKTHRLRSPQARANAARQLEPLRRAASQLPTIVELREALLAVNMRLWRIEDLIREKDASGDFGSGFVFLARSVYRENDERSRIKQAINAILQSEISEEKQYPDYRT